MLSIQEPGEIEVLAIAIEAIHGRGFELSIPESSPFYTFAYYNCPIVLVDQSGRHEWPAGVSLVWAPENPRYVFAESSDLLNTWFHFSGSGVVSCLTAYEIPVNMVLDLGELPFLKPILEEVRHERIQQPLHWQDAVSDLIRGLFRELGALKSELDHDMTPAQRKLERALRDVRMQVHSNLSHRWTVPEMAALTSLHPNWFATVYTKQFGSSPINDLINARLKHAEALLTHQPMAIARIAKDCGFRSVEHFTRLFHERMGCPPGQLRKHNKR